MTSNGGSGDPRDRRAFIWLLRIYPRDFRRRFGDGMRHALAVDHDAARRGGRWSLVGFWIRSAMHALVFGGSERLAALRPARADGRAKNASVERERMRRLWSELRHAGRRLRAAPTFTVTATVTLALGIGATTAMYSVVRAVVLKPLPYPDADRLVRLWHSAPGADIQAIGVSYGTYLHYRELSTTLEDLAIAHDVGFTVIRDGESERIRGAFVTGSVFDLLLDGPPALGRVLEERDQTPEADGVAVLSHRYWMQQYGSSPDVLGRRLDINGNPYEIVGVLPAGFDYPTPETDVWVQLRLDPPNVRLGQFNALGVGRLRENVTLKAARAELNELIQRLDERYPGPSYEAIVRRGVLTAELEPLKDAVVGGNVRTMLLVILGTVGFVLLIACANVTNLFLVRAEGRRTELALRTALGAGRLRLAGLFLSEGLVIGLIGGSLGLVIAFLGVDALVAIGGTHVPRLHEVSVSGPVLAFSATVSLLSGAAVGIASALRATADATPETLRAAFRGSTASRQGVRTRDVLVISQVALALVLLIGAGLMARSLRALTQVDPGFQAEAGLSFEVVLSARAYDRASAARFQQQLIDRLEGIQGVVAVGASDCIPLACESSVNPLSRADLVLGPNDLPPAVQLRTATAGFFRAAGILILRGREFEPADHEQQTGAAIVNRTLARRFWPRENPLGKLIYPTLSSDPPWYRVVGVVGDTPLRDLTSEPAPTAYFPMVGTGDSRMVPGPWTMTYVLRATGSPLSMIDAVRAQVRALDRAVPVTNIRTLKVMVADASATTRFAVILLTIGSMIATTLGAVGIYGVLSHTVSARRAEIGVRMALGARGSRMQTMVMARGMSVAAVGVVLGLAGAALLTRWLRSLLFGVSNTDLGTYGAVTVLVLLVAAAACYAPARRASRQDPRSALGSA